MIKDELEKLHYQVIQPSLEQARCQAGPMFRSCTPGTFDPFPALSAIFQEQMEMRKYELSNIVESIDCQSQGMTLDELDTLIMDLNTHDPGNPFKSYVRPADFGKEGYKVFDGAQWVEISEFSTIQMDDSFGQEIQVHVEDPTTGYRLRIFDDPSTPGIEMAESTYGMFPDEMGYGADTPYTADMPSAEPENRFAYWEDSYYQTIKHGAGIGGIVTGALEFRHVGDLTPWRTSLKDKSGWYRTLEGKRNPLSHQRGFGRGAGGHQMGALKASQRAKIYRVASTKFFYVSVGFSAYEIFDAHRNMDANKWGVTGKATLDITMGIVGFLGVPGLIISGTYFLGDALGWWGDWGKSDAQLQAEMEAQRQQQRYNQYLIEMSHDREFMIELEKTSRQELLENALQQVQDNTQLRMPTPLKDIIHH